MLDVTNFHKAIMSLKNAMDEYSRSPNEYVRDSCIQRFEYCYDSATKMIKRQLEYIIDNPVQVDSMSFQERIRSASEAGLLLNGWNTWHIYRDRRAASSHSYDEQVAKDVLNTIPQFYQEIIFLHEKLAYHNEQKN